MAIFILLSFCFLFIGTAGRFQRLSEPKGVRYAFILTLVFFFLWVDVSTEIMNICHIINKTGFISWWIATTFISAIWCVRHARFAKKSDFKKQPRFYLLALIFILLITGVIAAIAFPTNWDSMTYHLPRVMQWMSRESINHYPTNINRQLSQPPLAEYTILHIWSLSNIPALANWVQWIAFAGSIIIVSLITKELGGNRRTQWISAIVAATIPMAILQSTSTQNDVVVSFFIAGSLLSLIQYFKTRRDIKIVGIYLVQTALAILTKGTALIYCLPIFLVFLFIALHGTNANRIKHVGLSLIIVVLIAPRFIRNLQTFNKGFGPDYDLQNNTIGITALAANVPRNIGMHFRTWSDDVNEAITYGINTYENTVIGESNLPSYTWEYSRPFNTNPYSTHEDLAGNSLHTLLLLICLVLIFSRKTFQKRGLLVLVASILIAMILLFSLMLKWQIWHVRLHTPMYFIAAVIISIVIAEWKPTLRLTTVIICLVMSLPFLLVNQT